MIIIKDVKVKIDEACKLNRKVDDLSRKELAQVLDVSSTTIQNSIQFLEHLFKTLLTFPKFHYHLLHYE